MTGGTRWRDAMSLALSEAREALAHGDVPVGAVVLDPLGVPVARAHNERELTGDPTAHAEILALRRASATREALETGPVDGVDEPSPDRSVPPSTWRLSDHTLVVTLEPCTMCAGALVAARISTLVFGAFDPSAGAVASLWDVVRDPRLNHRVNVIGGVAEAECGALLTDFFASHRQAD